MPRSSSWPEAHKNTGRHKNTYIHNVYSFIVVYMKNTENDVTVIRVRKETRDRLAELGKKKETYDDIICRLMENNGWE